MRRRSMEEELKESLSRSQRRRQAGHYADIKESSLFLSLKKRKEDSLRWK